MTMTTLTSKGQLVVPKAIQTALRARPGTRFSVILDNRRIVLEPNATKLQRLSDWLPAVQVKRKLSDSELIAPVDGYTD